MISSVNGTTTFSFAVARSRYSNCPDQLRAYPAGIGTAFATAACMSCTAERRSRPRISTYTHPDRRASSLRSIGGPCTTWMRATSASTICWPLSVTMGRLRSCSTDSR
ncbi:hypothetical protein D3C81_1405490 [compost metagenome]